MLNITGIYSKTIYKDEATGYTGFFIESNDKGIITEIYCMGIISDYPIGTVLEIEGEKYRKGIKVTKCSLASHPFPTSLFSSIKGIGEEKIKRIKKITSPDIYEFAKRKDAEEKLKECLNEKDAKNVLKKIKEVSDMSELLSFITSFGGTYAEAKAVSRKYDEEGLNKIKENPYKISELSFETQERIGVALGISMTDEYRLSALLNATFVNIKNSGHTYIDADGLISYVRKTEKRKGTESFFIFASLLKENGKYIIEKGEKNRIYKRADYDNEVIAASNISRIIRTRKKLPIEEVSISDIENECGIQFDEDQEKALTLLKETGVKILTGGPGTGKTATMNGIVDAFLKMCPQAKISLCSPTANAAKRLSESTERRATTVHKLLNLKPFGDCFDAVDSLDSDLIIVDEASMIDMELLVMLVKAVKNGALLLFVGDEDQLPSVGNGNVLHDLLESSAIPKVRLRTIHRQHGSCSIVENSVKIRNGSTRLDQDFMSEFIRANSSEELQQIIIEKAKEFYDINAPQKTRIFSPVKKSAYDYSTCILNQHMHMIFNPPEENKDELKRNGKSFSKGDPVIMTRNNYESDYCNGDEGIVKAVLEESGQKYILVDVEGKELEIKGRDLEDIDLAYAVTTHKAQGSECDTAIIVIPERPVSMLDRSIIYVAATRAKRKNIFIIQNNALETGIHRKKLSERNTALTEKIEEEFKNSKKR